MKAHLYGVNYMANIKIGNKVFKNIETVEFPSANDPTIMKGFKSISILDDVLYPTEYFITLTMEEKSDGSAIVYMDKDTTELAGSYPLPLTKLNGWFVLFCEDDQYTEGNSINGYIVHQLGGKPNYSAAMDFGFSYTSQRNAGFSMGRYGSSLYNSEWGTEVGKYSMLKYNSSQFETIKNAGANFDKKKCRLYGFRYPIVGQTASLGDTDFMDEGEVAVNE